MLHLNVDVTDKGDVLVFVCFAAIRDCATYGIGLFSNLMLKQPFSSRTLGYANEQSHARFALLRQWSAPHSDPLMIGLNTPGMTSFTDLLEKLALTFALPSNFGNRINHLTGYAIS